MWRSLTSYYLSRAAALLVLQLILQSIVVEAQVNHPIYRRQSATELSASIEYPFISSTISSGYFIQISIGTPPQTFAVEVDTGSSNLFLDSQNCLDASMPCAHVDPFYNMNISTTASFLPCTGQCAFECGSSKDRCVIQEIYGDGSSLSAYGVRDVLNVAGTSVKIQFGAVYAETGMFASEADGIFGLAYQSLASANVQPPMDALVHAGLENVFALCLGNDTGTLTLGGADSALFLGDIKYTPITRQAYYQVIVEMLGFWNQTIAVPTNNISTIVDSGTGLVLMPYDVYQPFSTALQKAICSSSAAMPAFCDPVRNVFTSVIGFSITEQQLALLPTIHFALPDATSPNGEIRLEMTPHQYLVQVGTKQNPLRLFAFQLNRSPGGLFILGAALMRNYYVIFDRDEQRVGFASPSPDCQPIVSTTSPQTLSQNPSPSPSVTTTKAVPTTKAGPTVTPSGSKTPFVNGTNLNGTNTAAPVHVSPVVFGILVALGVVVLAGLGFIAWYMNQPAHDSHEYGALNMEGDMDT